MFQPIYKGVPMKLKPLQLNAAVVKPLLIAVAVSATGPVLAQEPVNATGTLEAEKQAPAQKFIPTAYGNVEARHVFKVEADDGETQNMPATLQLRPTLGASFFDDKLDSSITWVFSKETSSRVIKRDTLYTEQYFKFLDGDNYSLSAFGEIYLANGFGFSEAYLGGYATANSNDIETGAGALKFTAYMQPAAQMLSPMTSQKATKFDVTNRTGLPNDQFSLAAADQPVETKVEGDTPTVLTFSGVGTSFSPSAVEGLKIGLTADLTQTWTPEYEAIRQNGAIESQQSGYNYTTNIMNRFQLGYKINDRLSVGNELRFRQQGLYARSPDPAAGEGIDWENRLKLTATLF